MANALDPAAGEALDGLAARQEVDRLLGTLPPRQRMVVDLVKYAR